MKVGIVENKKDHCWKDGNKINSTTSLHAKLSSMVKE